MNPVINCPNCDSRGPRSAYSVRDRHYGNQGLFTYSVCGQCGLEFLDPMPSENELMSYYPQESYYAYSIQMPKPEPRWKSFLRTILFLGYETKDPAFSEPGRLLDIGCGSGWFMHKMRVAGWQVKGVEPSKAGAEAGRKMANLDIHEGDLLSTNFPSDHFDYIRLNHAFEHIPNPVPVLREIHRILRPDGKVFIGVPNVAGLNAKIFKEYWYYLGAPVHTFNYSDKTLPSLVRKEKFRNIEVKFNSNYKGMLGSIQIFLNRKSGKSSESGLLFRILPFRILSGFISKVMNLARTGDCIEVIFEK